MARIVVTDGDVRASLAIVRSLARAGHDVTVCGPARHCLAGASRYAQSKVSAPGAEESPLGFAQELHTALVRVQPAVVIPVTEASIRAVISGPALPEGVALPFQPAQAFEILSDKRRVLATASEIGFRIPQQAVLETPGDIGKSVAIQLAFPVAIKPSRSVAMGDDGRMYKQGTRYVQDRAALSELLLSMPPDSYPLLVQEYIPGAGVGVFLLRWGGKLVAAFSHERLREKPPTGGVSVRARSRELPVELRNRCEALLAACGWNGVAMVEFKEHNTTGELFLMEVNARFWGSLELAIHSGVDFPALLVDCVLGQSLPDSLPPYRTGAEVRWFWGEIDHLVTMLQGRQRSPVAGARPARSVAHTAFHILSPFQGGAREEVLRANDPAPFLRESVWWLADAGRGLVRKAGSI